MPTQNFFDQLLIFVNLYQHAKNQLTPSFRSSYIVNFKVSSPRLTTLIFDHLTPKIFKHFLICVNLCQHEKNQLIPSVHFGDIVNFIVQRPDWPDPFLTTPSQKIFD